MKPVLFFLLLAAFILAACQPKTVQTVSKVCLESCDEILAQLARTSGVLDEALIAANAIGAANDASRLFLNSGDELDDLFRVTKASLPGAAQDAFQVTDDILRTAPTISDHLRRLGAWADETQEGREFFGNLVCAYREAYLNASATGQGDPTYADVAFAFIDRYSNAPPDAEDIIEPLDRVLGDLQQKKVNIWDRSVTLYCMVTGVIPD